jgi:hypothetical protein
MRCPHCDARLATEDVLEAGTVAIPGTSIIQFRCPSCAAGGWARLGDGHVALGVPNRDPAAFEPVVTAEDAKLSVRPEHGWVDCWYEGRYRRFPRASASAPASA